MKHHNTEWTEMSRTILVLAIIIQACAGQVLSQSSLTQQWIDTISELLWYSQNLSLVLVHAGVIQDRDHIAFSLTAT